MIVAWTLIVRQIWRYSQAVGFAALLAASLAVNAQTVHLVLIADSDDANIGTGAAANSKLVSEFINRAAAGAGVAINRVELSGKLFSCQRIKDAVSQLAPGSDDTVIFYYSGHGFRTGGNNSKFPELYCGEEAFAGNAPALTQISRDLAKKGARLTIVVADSCNVVVSLPVEPKAAAAMIFPRTRDDQYRSLLLKHKGVLTLTGSVKDQYSWYLPSGGFFTKQFLAALESATQSSRTGLWTDVLRDALREIPVPVGPTQTVKQQPESESQLVRVTN